MRSSPPRENFAFTKIFKRLFVCLLEKGSLFRDLSFRARFKFTDIQANLQPRNMVLLASDADFDQLPRFLDTYTVYLHTIYSYALVLHTQSV